MSLAYNSSIVRDGLVFHFDLDNKKSWKGKPTTNLVNNTPSQAGWNGFYTLEDSSSKTFHLTSIQNNASNTSAWRTWYWNVSGYVGQTITISADVKFIQETNASFQDITIGQGNTGQFSTHIKSSDPADKITISTKPIEKTRMSWTGTINSTAIVGFTLWITDVAADGANGTIEISNVQIEANDFPTKFVDGQRLDTASIIDIAKKNEIRPVNLTYQEGVGPQFDGTNDHMRTFTNNQLFNTNDSWTVSALLTVKSLPNIRSGLFTNQRYLSEANPGGFGVGVNFNNTYIVMLTHDDGAGNISVYQAEAPMSITPNVTELVTYTYDHATKTISAYRNGELVNSNTNTSYKWSAGGGVASAIGTNTQGGWGNYMHMDLHSLQVYKKALTQAEIQKNFAASRSRYGI